MFVFLFELGAKNNQFININFRNMSIEELIKITSKQLNKNILYVGKIKGNVDLITNKAIKKEKLLEILDYALSKKGYLLKKDDDILKIENLNSDINSQKRVIKVIKIENLEAENILQVLNTIFSNKQSKTLPLITTEKDTNSIIITGLQSDVKKVEKFISDIDVQSSQIYIKAKIIEISETRTKEIGLEYGLRGFNKYSSSSLSTFSSSFNSLKNDSIDFTEFSTFGFDISSLSKGLTLGATINFLKQNQGVDVISEPSILCINNKESSIYVGETKSFKTGQTTNNSGTTESYKREEIGLRLKVKPRVTENKIILEINTILEDAKESTTSSNLDTSKKEVKTTAILNNGESVIIGGLIKSRMFQMDSGLPLLKDIPILGTLFKNQKDVNDKINLVVVITPFIIPKDTTLSVIKSKVDYLDSLQEVYVNNLLKSIEGKSAKKEKKTTSEENHKKILKKYFNIEN